MTAGVRDAAARWARAFPRRWRARHVDALLDTVEEMVPTGADRLPRGVAVDLVRAGWAERWRDRPPLTRWARYAIGGGRLPERWHGWLLDDVTGRWFWLRVLLRRQAVIVATFSAVWWGATAVVGPAPFPWPILVGPLLASPLFALGARRHRDQALRQHGLDERGAPAPPPAWPPPWAPSPSASHPVAGGATVVAACALAMAARLYATAVDVSGAVVLAAAPIAAVVGAAGAVRLERRARLAGRRGDRPPLAHDQHVARRLVGALVALASFVLAATDVVAFSGRGDTVVMATVLAGAGLAATGLAVGAGRRGTGAALCWADLIAPRSAGADRPIRLR